MIDIRGQELFTYNDLGELETYNLRRPQPGLHFDHAGKIHRGNRHNS